MPDGTATEIAFGLLGCGGFGRFAAGHFVRTPGTRLVAVADEVPAAAAAAAAEFGVPDAGSVKALLAHPDVDLVYIATPPHMHHPQTMAALAAGKHVICEKPLALSVEQGEEMIAEARRRGLLMVVDLMQRYNPLYDSVSELVASRVLGEVVHGSFENLASDEGLPPDHWFWDRAQSGGIFVEHGVHFFDMFAGWLGPGRVESARVGLRPGTALEEHVGCTVQYADGAWVDMYHGFHQTHRMDRQLLRLVFERGDVTLHEWVPTRARIHAIADEGRIRELTRIFPGAEITTTATYQGAERLCRGRGQELDVHRLVDLDEGADVRKWERYGELLRAMFADQTTWIRDRGHRRRITEENARASLATACAADRLARSDGTGRRGAEG